LAAVWRFISRRILNSAVVFCQQYGFHLQPELVPSLLDQMATCLNTINTSVKWGVLRKGPRLFALLGKATPQGIVSFSRQDLSTGWALTAEFGCLRLEHLSGDEELTEFQLAMPTPFSYDYGLTGTDSPELTRAVFGLLPSELEQLTTRLRQGSFPILGFSQTEQKCCITSSLIPGRWPHVVVSNLALYGNIVSVEAFVRIIVSSLSQGHLGIRHPSLRPVIRQVIWLSILRRRGIHYTNEAFDLAPATGLAAP